MGENIAFTHLHVHSHYSILDGMSKINELVDKCLRCGMKSLALTDHGNMFGIKEFSDYCEKVNGKLKEKGEPFFKPIFGIEAYCAPVSVDKRDGRTDRGWHLILLAKNRKGYENLCKLSSIAYIDGFYYNPRIDHSLLEQYKEGLIVSSACLGGEIPQKIMKNDIAGAEESVKWFKKLFGDDFYLELQRHKTDKPLGDREVYERQVEVNKVLLELAEKYNIKVIATNDVHFVEEEHGEAHDRLICVSTAKDFDDATRMHYTKQEWLKTPEEMYEIFKDVPEAITNTQEIVDKVESYSLKRDPIMPAFAIPEDFGTVEGYRKKFSEEDLFNEFTRDENGKEVMSREKAEDKIKKLGGYDKLYRIKLEADYLAKLTWEGAEKRYGSPLPDDIKERIVFELHVMKTMGFPGYFLIVQDYIRGAREELDVMVGPGRGSAAGSVVAYCLKITDLDPLKYDLLFERFLNPDRISLPDIDVDFEDCGRERVLQWVTEKYGREKVAHIITYGVMATKSAVADVARVQRVPLELVNKIKSFIPEKDFDDSVVKPDEKGKKPPVTLANCIKYIPEIKAYAESQDSNISSMMTYAAELEGTNRQIGMHACGVIIGADDLTKFAPLCTVKDKDKKTDVVVTQYDGHVVEDVGLIKMDFLGLSTLTIIRDAISNVKKTHGIDIDIDSIPIDDELTYELYSEGNTIATFQFESPGMRKYLRELKPTVIGDIIAMNALYRPGPMDNIPDFIARKQGKQPITYDFQCMEKYLKDTYGICVYQEQVMLLSRELADFTRGESDTLRKAMGKKQLAKMEELYGKFMKQGVEKLTVTENLPQDEVESRLKKIWEEWKKFASYAFNKSHAACYSWVAYQTAYLKAHYPQEYMAAVLNNVIGDAEKLIAMVNECKRMKIEVLPPDVNCSDYNFNVDEKGRIYYGFGGLKGMGEAAAQGIIDEREANGPFKDFTDFLLRTVDKGLMRKTIEILASAGALDCFKELHRAAYFYIAPNETVSFIEKSFKMVVNYLERKNNAQYDLFGATAGDAAISFELPIPQCDRWSKLRELEEEKAIMGFYLSSHPLDVYSHTIKYFATITTDKIPSIENIRNKEFKVAGFVTSAKEFVAKNGNKYGKYKVEDKFGVFEFPLFKEKYMKFGCFMTEGTAVLVSGTVVQSFRDKDTNPDANELRVDDVRLLDSILEETNRQVKIMLDINTISHEQCRELVKIIKGNPGKQPYSIIVVDNGEKMRCTLVPTKGGVNAGEIFRQFDELEYVAYDLSTK
ncbi:MAG: DNA polymerase III subunit alpha [Bacteroidales bacterium]|nr:DNA polymerase III subunit alpha [Bacteroidales bacterium]